MSRPKNKTETVADAEPDIPSITPPGIGHPMYSIHQTCIDLQKSITEVKTSLDHITKGVDGIKTKVDDLVKWKNMILGGAVTLGVLLSFGYGIYKEFKNEYSLVPKSEIEKTISPSVATLPADEDLPEKPHKLKK